MRLSEMGSEVFRFRCFALDQRGCGMRLTTDGVLLGAWCRLPDVGRLLDVGTGTGILALMAAQRAAGLTIEAVEIDPVAADCARRNGVASPWSERIRIVQSDAREYPQRPVYTVVVSNPPYFDETLRSTDAARRRARHTGELGHDDLLRVALRALAPEGTFALILPSEAADRFVLRAGAAGLALRRECRVRYRAGGPVRRSLLEFVRGRPAEPVREELTLTDGGVPTAAYRALTADFYLDR